MRRLLDDDIRTRLTKMDERGLTRRYIRMIQELTSRKDSTEIPAILDHLETPFDPALLADNEKRRKAKQKVERLDPLDVILATNMISVGVDVRRLGMMVACGQPKNTAEYIQATSRVGRTYPGLVLTVYNWARPRDLSHYERFEHYHGTFYQHVEALSVTPFAPGALYRGLSGVLTALIRLGGEELNGNDKAGNLRREHPDVQAAIKAIVQRAELVTNKYNNGDRGNKAIVTELRDALEAKLDFWLSQSNQIGGRQLKYNVTSQDGISIPLLIPAGKGNWQDFTCLNSLRNVEPTINLIFTDDPPDDDLARPPQPFVKSQQ